MLMQEEAEYQVDTGSIAFPDLRRRAVPLIDCLGLAFVAFNQADFADFVIEQPTAVIEDDEDVWSRSTCECDLCTKMNQTLDHWDSWKPQSEIEKMLQKVINGMDV